jgi:hypothetical protein
VIALYKKMGYEFEGVRIRNLDEILAQNDIVVVTGFV